VQVFVAPYGKHGLGASALWGPPIPGP